MVAVQAALDISEADMGYALVIDSIDYSLWVMFLLRVIQLAPKFNKWTKADTSKLGRGLLPSGGRGEAQHQAHHLPESVLLLGSAFLVSAIATNVGNKLYALTNFSDKATWTVLFVTVVALIAAVTPLGKGRRLRRGLQPPALRRHRPAGLPREPARAR